MDQQHNF